MKSGGDMNVDEVWDATDRERIAIADLLDELADDEWEHPSLCDGWRVRDVAAHLSMAQTGVAEAAVALVRARFGFNRMIHDTAVRRSGRPREEFTAALRGMAGSRKRAPGISHIEPLTDVLVHTQDIVVPLGRSYAMPPRAAAFCAERVWTMGFPFHARRRFRDVRLVATDTDWTAGSGRELVGPIDAILLALTGREAGSSRLRAPDPQALP